MKEVKAIIQPFMANHVLDALRRIEGVSGVMTPETRCTNATRDNLNPDINTRIELILPAAPVDEDMEAMQVHVHAGRRGNGHIFVIDVNALLLMAQARRKHRIS